MRRIDDVRDEVIAGDDRRRLTLGLPRGPSRGRADLKHLRAMTEAEIRKTAPAELANLPRDFWKDAVLVRPGPRGKRKR